MEDFLHFGVFEQRHGCDYGEKSLHVKSNPVAESAFK